jgi:hypothetical protein
MARTNAPRRLFRRSVVLGTLIVLAVAGLALERTATGATTGNPSHAKSHHHYDPPKHVTTTTHRYYPPPTTAKHGPPVKEQHCGKIFVFAFDKHHHKIVIVKFHCRAAN